MFYLLELGGGEVVRKLGNPSIEVGGDTVGLRIFYGAFYEAEHLDAHEFGTTEKDGGIFWVKGMELDMVIVVDHLFDQGFVAIDKDHGYAAAIDA